MEYLTGTMGFGFFMQPAGAGSFFSAEVCGAADDVCEPPAAVLEPEAGLPAESSSVSRWTKMAAMAAMIRAMTTTIATIRHFGPPDWGSSPAEVAELDDRLADGPWLSGRGD